MQKIELDSAKLKELNAVLSKFDSYKKFSSSKPDAYKYAKILGVRVCPYCNINYTYTVLDSGEKEDIYVCRPDFDHLIAQCVDPSLSQAVENLIPSCLVCNRTIKGRKEFSDETHLHPFREDFDQIKRFSVDILSASYLEEHSIILVFKDRVGVTEELSDKASNNIKDFRLNERYMHHCVDAAELLSKASYYHRQRKKEICDLLNIKDLRKHLFSELRGNDINQSPLSKMKRDILELIL